jgi:hypothetical protein
MREVKGGPTPNPFGWQTIVGVPPKETIRPKYNKLGEALDYYIYYR